MVAALDGSRSRQRRRSPSSSTSAQAADRLLRLILARPLRLVASLARPGGNLTGLSSQTTDTVGKRVELLREVVPGLRRLAILGNVDNPLSVLEMRDVRAAARTLGLQVDALEIRRTGDIDLEAFKGGADALYVAPDPLVIANRIRINTFALAARLPTMYGFREYVEAAGLMAYGANFPDLRDEARQHPGRAADQVRPHHKHYDREGSWP